MKKPRVGDLVVVEWRDARSMGAGWHDIEELQGEPLSDVVSVGWVARSDGGDSVALYATEATNETEPGIRHVAGCTVIPWPWVHRVTVLRGSRGAQKR